MLIPTSTYNLKNNNLFLLIYILSRDLVTSPLFYISDFFGVSLAFPLHRVIPSSAGSLAPNLSDDLGWMCAVGTMKKL